MLKQAERLVIPMVQSGCHIRCLLGAHGLFLCLCLVGMATAQPNGDLQVSCFANFAACTCCMQCATMRCGAQPIWLTCPIFPPHPFPLPPQRTASSSGLDDLLAELSSGSVAGTNAFKLFVQRAQLVVAGLMHVSVLLLPRLTAAAAPKPSDGGGGKHKRGGGGAGQPSAPPGSGAKSSSATGGASPAPGFPADGSDLAAWERSNAALERHSASGYDWSNSCVYTLSEDRGAVVEPQPEYPVAATAAFRATRGRKGEAVIINDVK